IPIVTQRAAAGITQRQTLRLAADFSRSPGWAASTGQSVPASVDSPLAAETISNPSRPFRYAVSRHLIRPRRSTKTVDSKPHGMLDSTYAVLQQPTGFKQKQWIIE